VLPVGRLWIIFWYILIIYVATPELTTIPDIRVTTTMKDTSFLSYPERLSLVKVDPQTKFEFLREIKYLFVKIPLLHAMKDVPIYAKTVRDLCLKRPGRKPKDPPTIHIIGKLFDLMLGKDTSVKYDDPGNPMLTIQINHTDLPNTLVDLGATINVMTIGTLSFLGLCNLRPTPIVLELADRSTVNLLGVLEDIIISVDSWEYPVDFLVLKIQSKLDGHPLILGSPWLATADSYIE
jgi:hypothetical protein